MMVDILGTWLSQDWGKRAMANKSLITIPSQVFEIVLSISPSKKIFRPNIPGPEVGRIITSTPCCMHFNLEDYFPIILKLGTLIFDASPYDWPRGVCGSYNAQLIAISQHSTPHPFCLINLLHGFWTVIWFLSGLLILLSLFFIQAPGQRIGVQAF